MQIQAHVERAWEVEKEKSLNESERTHRNIESKYPPLERGGWWLSWFYPEMDMFRFSTSTRTSAPFLWNISLRTTDVNSLLEVNDLRSGSHRMFPMEVALRASVRSEDLFCECKYDAKASNLGNTDGFFAPRIFQHVLTVRLTIHFPNS